MPLTFGFPLFSEAIQAVYLNLTLKKSATIQSLEPSPRIPPTPAPHPSLGVGTLTGPCRPSYMYWRDTRGKRAYGSCEGDVAGVAIGHWSDDMQSASAGRANPASFVRDR